MAIFKKRVSTPSVMLNATMDQRSNNEILNVGDEAQKLVCYNLENADLFNTASIQTRNGTEDLSCGIINYNFTDTCVYDTATSGLSVSGSTLTNVQVPYYSTSLYDYPVSIFIPQSDLTLKTSNLRIQGVETSGNYANLVASGESNYSFILEAHLFKTNQTPINTVSMSGTNSDTHNIGIGGTLDFPGGVHIVYDTMPGGNNNAIPSGCIPVASAQVIVNLGDYNVSGTDYVTDKLDVEIPFSAPAFVSSGTVYGIRYDLVQTSGSFAKTINMDVIANNTNEVDVSSCLMQEFYYGGAPANQTFALRRFGPLTATKAWQYGNICFQNAVGFLNPDFKTASKSIAFPILHATNPANQPDPFSYEGYTEPIQIGQTIASTGTDTIFGSYAYFGPNSVAGSPRYNYDGTLLSGTKNVGVYSRLYSQDSNGIGYTQIASASGNIVLDFEQNVEPQQGLKNIFTDVDMSLEKVYFIYDNPVTIASGNYVVTFGLYDYNTGGAYGDYIRTPDSIYYYNQCAVRIGVETQQVYNGSVQVPAYYFGVFDEINSTYLGTYSPNNVRNLACGLITVASGNATTLIYDYRVGSDLNQKVIIGQRDKLYWTEFSNPCKDNYTVIHSGAAINNDALWSALTFNDLLFAHQYSQSSGIVWDSAYSGVAYEHGKRPTFTASGVTAAGSTLPSGTYSIVLATSHDSGGFRSSVVSGVTIASGQWIHVGGLNMQNQFPFDLSTQSTYIFMTEASGATYYAPVLYDAASLTPSELPQPIANNIVNAYINTPIIVSGTGANNSVANTLDPAYPQTYLLNQIDTPKFKKIMMFNNYMFGIGDPNYPSRLYYSDILAPQIWSEDGTYGGTYEIYPDNGQDLTGMEVAQQFAMLFKKNSTYRLEYTDNLDIPWAVVQISPNIGCLGVFTTVNTEKGIFGLSQYGPFVCSPNSIDIIGQEILPWFKNLDHDDLTFSVASHDQINQVITWSISNNNTNSDRNFALVFNYKENSWLVRRGQVWNCAGIVRDVDNFDQIWIGDVLGTVKRDNVNNTDADIVFNDGNTVETTRAIEMVIETPWMSFNGAKGSDSDKNKLFRFAQFNVETAIGSNLTIDVYYDYETSPRYTRILPINTGSSNKRINLGGQGKIVKFKIYNSGEPNKIKINKILLEYQALGSQEPSA